MAKTPKNIPIEDDLYREFKSRAAREGMTIVEACDEAFNLWLDKKLDEESAALAAGTGSVPRAKNNPETYQAALDKKIKEAKAKGIIKK